MRGILSIAARRTAGGAVRVSAGFSPQWRYSATAKAPRDTPKLVPKKKNIRPKETWQWGPILPLPRLDLELWNIEVMFHRGV